jgi:Aminotransferase class I and II
VPNGVSGDVFTPTVGPVDFRVVDIVFQSGGFENQSAAVHAARVRVSSGVDGTAVLMTPAKDLSVPGIRAGMLVSDYAPLVAAARRRHFNGLATINPVIGQLILLYLAALLLADADRAPGGFDTAFRWLGDQFTRHRVEPMSSASPRPPQQ